MCQRIAYLLLGSLFTFIVATVAAFAYLEWWQAILASAATFVLLIMIIKFYFKYLFQQGVGKMKNLAKGMLEGKSRVLRGATADVHTVKPASVPTSVRNWATPILEGHVDEEDEDTEHERDEANWLLNDCAWFEIETTIFPDPNQARDIQHWDIDDLRLVPFNTPASSFDSNDDEPADRESEFVLHDTVMIQDGEVVRSDESKLQGPQRLRFTVGIPRNIHELKFQYYFEQFGLIKLPSSLSLPPRNPR